MVAGQLVRPLALYGLIHLAVPCRLIAAPQVVFFVILEAPPSGTPVMARVYGHV